MHGKVKYQPNGISINGPPTKTILKKSDALFETIDPSQRSFKNLLRSLAANRKKINFKIGINTKNILSEKDIPCSQEYS